MNNQFLDYRFILHFDSKNNLRRIYISNSHDNHELLKIFQCSVTDVSNPVFAIEATVEKLIQRLVRGASALDPRFSSMFLVSLNEPRRMKVKLRANRNRNDNSSNRKK